MTKIFQFGTFDVNNYGDLLFPLLAQKELSLQPDLELTRISPIGGSPAGIINATASISIQEAITNNEKIDAAIIGGGNIIHCMPSSLESYTNARTASLAYSNLWLGPTFLLPENTPIVWNAPGVPGPLRREHHQLIKHALQRANYLSVRDEMSKQFLLDVWPDANITVVPDTAWALPRLWSLEGLSLARQRLFSSMSVPIPDRSVVFHLNRRYLKGTKLSEIAKLLDAIADSVSAQPLLIPFAPCHGDDVLAKEVAHFMTSRPILTDAASLQEIAACVALADNYVGSSMHGLITALTYGVPALAVAPPSMPKFDGVVRLVNRPDLVFDDWREAPERILQLNPAATMESISQLQPIIYHAIDAHWERIRNCASGRIGAPASMLTHAGRFIGFQQSAADIQLQVLKDDSSALQRAISQEFDKRLRAQRVELNAEKEVQKRQLLKDMAKQERQLGAENRRLKAKLKRMEKSISWKLTVPLRIASSRYPVLGNSLITVAKSLIRPFRPAPVVRTDSPVISAPSPLIPDVSGAIVEYASSTKNTKRKYVVYTAIFGEYDQLLPPQFIDNQVDYVCFTDRPKNDCGIWQLRPSPYYHNDPTRVARYIKTHPHSLLKDYEFAIWVDGNVAMTVGVEKYIEALLIDGTSLGTIPHPLRSCFYEEARECKKRRKDQASVIDKQVECYRRRGLLENRGLFETNFMVIRLADHQVSAMFATWWNEIVNFSRRDQLALAWALQEHELRISELLPKGVSVREDSDFSYFIHEQCRDIKIPTGITEIGHQTDPYADQKFKAIRTSALESVKNIPIDIVVCVYNALEDVSLCLDSVRTWLLPNHRLIIVNDCSDSQTSAYLTRTTESDERITLLNNAQNLGYTKSANRGLAASTAPFRILLNSDTIVAKDWALKMLFVANTSNTIGIVGPLSNAASYQSVPRIKGTKHNTAINELPAGLLPAAIDQAAEAWSSAQVFPIVPLVHGFCLGIKAQVIEKIGFFDEKNFEKYYGEENDYCFRARSAGFELAIATNTFVYHRKSRSIEEELRIVHMAAAGKKLRELYGDDAVKTACAQMEHHPLLIRVREAATQLFSPIQSSQSAAEGTT